MSGLDCAPPPKAESPDYPSQEALNPSQHAHLTVKRKTVIWKVTFSLFLFFILEETQGIYRHSRHLEPGIWPESTGS